MKLATIRNGSRDGRLAIVSKDLTRAVLADPIAPTLLDALERWSEVESALRARYQQLERAADHGAAAALLPMARWLDVRQSRLVDGTRLQQWHQQRVRALSARLSGRVG